MSHAGLLRKVLEGERKVKGATTRRRDDADGDPKPTLTYQEVTIREIDEVWSLIRGLCQRCKEDKEAGDGA